MTTENSTFDPQNDEQWLAKVKEVMGQLDDQDAEAVVQNFIKYLSGEMTYFEYEGKEAEDYSEAIQLAYSLLRNKKAADAEKIFESLCFLDHKNVLFKLGYASCLSKLGKLDEALTQYTLTLELDPLESSARINRAEILYKLGYFDEPIEELNYALSHSKAERDSWLSRARALVKNIAEEKQKLKIPNQVGRVFHLPKH